jgi:hypothetical protein
MATDLDASTFQRKLETLAEVLAQKLRREAPKLLGATPGYVLIDLHVMLRQMIYTYNLFSISTLMSAWKETHTTGNNIPSSCFR